MTTPRLSKNPNKAPGNATTPTSDHPPAISNDEVDTDDETAVTAPVDEETAGMTPAELEAHKAKQIETEAYQKGKAARQGAIAEQQAAFNGAINDITAADQAGADAAQEVRDRARAHRRPGVYVRSPITAADDDGNRIECPVGMRLTDKMVAQLGVKQLAQLKKAKVLEDLR